MANDFSFEARNKKFEKILFSQNNVYYKIPRYQRPYAWDAEQINEFWHDLYNSSESYFLGSFIFNTEYEDDHKYIEVIDGQQRMLTTTIFMAVLRDIAKDIGELKLSDLIQRNYISYEDKNGNQSFRIMPGDSTKDFFERNIQNVDNSIRELKPVEKEHKRIQANYLDLYSKVEHVLNSSATNEQKKDTITSLRDKTDALIAIEVRIQSDNLAYEIFETVNARGVELSVSDLLKNLLFSKMRNDGTRDLAKEFWDQINSNISDTGIPLKKFIRYDWLSQSKFVQEKKLYSEIKRNITNWEDYLYSLHDSSKWFLSLHQGHETDFSEIKSFKKIYRSIFAIRLMNVSQCHVLFLALLKNHKDIEMKLEKLYLFIENFTFRYNAVCKLPGNKVERLYSGFAKKISDKVRSNDGDVKKAIETLINDLKTELKKLSPTREEFIEKFMNIEYKSSTSARQLITYTLERIGNLDSTKEKRINFDEVNIEHILPQTPENWGLDKAEIKSYVNKIGNLVLLSKRKNSAVGNEKLSTKIDVLKTSEIKMTNDLGLEIERIGKWDESLILDRQRTLAGLAYDKIWTLN